MGSKKNLFKWEGEKRKVRKGKGIKNKKMEEKVENKVFVNREEKKFEGH